MAELGWSLKAEADLQAIEEFIAKDSVLRAITLVDRIVRAAERLALAPQAGRAVPEFSRLDLREVICRGYRVVYLVSGEAVTDLRVVHGAREGDQEVRDPQQVLPDGGGARFGACSYVRKVPGLP